MVRPQLPITLFFVNKSGHASIWIDFLVELRLQLENKMPQKILRVNIILQRFEFYLLTTD